MDLLFIDKVRELCGQAKFMSVRSFYEVSTMGIGGKSDISSARKANILGAYMSLLFRGIWL